MGPAMPEAMTGTTVKILIPRQAGGLIIGKGGATIRVSSTLTLSHRLCTYLGMSGGVDDSMCWWRGGRSRHIFSHFRKLMCFS